MKIKISRILWIASMLIVSNVCYTMNQEPVAAAPLGALLRNGARARLDTIVFTHLNVVLALRGNDGKGGFAIIELVQNCRNEASPISQKSGEHLLLYGLVDATHKPLPELKDIIVSMAIGNGLEMKIVSPIK
ncbi:MAG: hypothetical protein AB7F19_02050 [Candidatus Babeliales bacterium]